MIRPGLVKKINRSDDKFKQMENVSRGCALAASSASSRTSAGSRRSTCTRRRTSGSRHDVFALTVGHDANPGLEPKLGHARVAGKGVSELAAIAASGSGGGMTLLARAPPRSWSVRTLAVANNIDFGNEMGGGGERRAGCEISQAARPRRWTARIWRRWRG